MANHPRTVQPARQSALINVTQLTSQYYVLQPATGNSAQAVKFGTSGHFGSAGRHSFNEVYILGYRRRSRQKGDLGPCYVGKDTHAALRAGVHLSTGSDDRQRGRGYGTGGQRLHAGDGDFYCYPHLQSRRWRTGRRHPHHPFPQSVVTNLMIVMDSHIPFTYLAMHRF